MISGRLPAGLSFDADRLAVVGVPEHASSVHLVMAHGRPGHDLQVRTVEMSVGARPSIAVTSQAVSGTTGSITGTVTGPGGPLDQACVIATSASGHVVQALTSSAGSYAIDYLRPGFWEVEFQGCANSDVSQWWSRQTSQTTARAVDVKAGAVSRKVSATLAVGGAITGVVTDSASSPVEGVCVYAESEEALNGAPTVADGAAITNPSGRYTVIGLPSGSYLVEFAPCTKAVNLQPLWWQEASDATFASGVSVVAGQTTPDVSPVLQPGGRIVGTVTSATTHRGIPGECVEAISSGGLAASLPYLNGMQIGLAVTGSTGGYILASLPAGQYLVQFFPCGSSANYAPALWRQASPIENTPAVTVTAGETSDASTTLSPQRSTGGAVSGRVTSARTGRGIGGVCVLIASPAGNIGVLVVTAANGTYLAQGIPAGSYEADFAPCLPTLNYTQQVWHHGETFHVSKGATTRGISVALTPGAVISGTLRSSTGAPLTAQCVLVTQILADGSSSEGFGAGFGGRYAVVGLSPGKYTVSFGGCNGGDYNTEAWHHGATIKLARGEVVRGIDFVLGPGGEITGAVTLAGGGPASLVCVGVVGNSGFPPVDAEAFSSLGRYVVSGLPTGRYQVGFAPCGSPTDDYQATSINRVVRVTAGKVTSGVSAQLPLGGEISGTVTSASAGALPLSLICITVIPAFSQNAYSTETVAGAYELFGLAPGSYEVQFSPCGQGGYHGQWWQGSSGQSGATPISVTAGNDTSGINASLQPS